jgi:hypothetical protein
MTGNEHTSQGNLLYLVPSPKYPHLAGCDEKQKKNATFILNLNCKLKFHSI